MPTPGGVPLTMMSPDESVKFKQYFRGDRAKQDALAHFKMT